MVENQEILTRRAASAQPSWRAIEREAARVSGAQHARGRRRVGLSATRCCAAQQRRHGRVRREAAVRHGLFYRGDRLKEVVRRDSLGNSLCIESQIGAKNKGQLEPAA